LCPLSRTCQPVKPRLNPNAALTVVESWPARSEDERGEPTRHPASELLRKNLASAGVDEYGYTYAILCRPPKGTTKKDIDAAIECCQPRLQSDVAPEQDSEHERGGERRWVLSLGAEAFRATTGKLASLDAWVGAPLDAQWPGVRCVPTWSPGWILKPDGSAFAPVFASHVWRAAYLSDGRLPGWDWGRLVIADTLEPLREIMAAIQRGQPYAMDIEADGKGFGANITCIGFAVEGLAVSVALPFESKEVEQAVRIILLNGTMLTQNGSSYDREMLRRKGFALTPRYEDCLLAASILDPQLPKNLGFLTSSEFSAEAHKSNFRQDKESGIVADLWSATDPETIRKRLEYNAKDCVVTLLVWGVQQKRLAAYG
jgi:uracil-DNA glycosylase